MLDIWLITLLINLRVYYFHDLNENDVIATLQHNDRISEVRVQNFDKDSFKRLVASMHVPFPVLTDLSLANCNFTSPPLPDSFLGGSAPGLRLLYLHGIAALGLPNLLLSATCLIHLRLDDIPHFGPGYISPYVMADCLSSLTRLEHLRITFTYQPHPYQTSLRPPLLKRTILPKLTYLFFKGMNEYLEVLFNWIETPLHKDIHLEFFNPVNFDISQISWFIGREELTTEEVDGANMRFNDDLLEVTLISRKEVTGGTSPKLSVKCGDSAWQLQSLSHWWRSPSPFLPSLGLIDLTEYASGCSPPWTRNMEKARWLEFLHLFAAVENLYLSEELVRCIALTLRDLAAREGGAVTVLPALKCLFIRLIQRPFHTRTSPGHHRRVHRCERICRTPCHFG